MYYDWLGLVVTSHGFIEIRNISGNDCSMSNWILNSDSCNFMVLIVSLIFLGNDIIIPSNGFLVMVENGGGYTMDSSGSVTRCYMYPLFDIENLLMKYICITLLIHYHIN